MPDNNLITPKMITYNLLDEFINALNIVPMFDTKWASDFGKSDMKIGDTEFIRKPQRFVTKDGAGYQPQPISDSYATLTIDTHKQISFDWTAFQEVLSIEDQYNRYFKKSITQLANDADDACSGYAAENLNNITGVLGTSPASLADAQALMTNMYALMVNKGCPTEDLGAILSPGLNATQMAYLNTLYNPQAAIGRQVENGVPMTNQFGFKKVATDPNIRRQTCGTFTGTPTVLTTSVNGATSLATTGWTAGDFLNPGNIVSIGSCLAVNPKNRRSFVTPMFIAVGSYCEADSGGLMTIPFAGGLALYDSSQQLANCDSLPAAGATITVFSGTSSPSTKSGSQSLVLGPQAFAFAPIKLPKMAGCNISETEQDPDTKISLAIHQGSDIKTYERISRIDSAWGIASLYPDNEGGRLLGA